MCILIIVFFVLLSVQSLMLFMAHLLHVFKCNEVSKAALDTMSLYLFGINIRPRWSHAG